MQKTQFIKDIGANDDVDSFFLLGAAAIQQARNGPFWRLELKDASGTLEAKIWSPQSQEYTGLAAGQIVEVQGRSSTFRDQAQVTIDRLRRLSTEETAACDLALFLPASARPAHEMLEELEQICGRELAHMPWKKFVLAVLRHPDIRPLLLTAPAAKSVHHAYVGGLLEHMLSVAGLALRLADHYPELDRQVLLAAAVCHDLGKIWELTGGLANDYSDAGRLLGHTILGLERLEPFLQKSGLHPELARHFKHLILSHHGEHQYGAPQLPQTAEAFVLHYADNIDAKVTQCRQIFNTFTEDDSAWSPYQATLGRCMHQPARTPKNSAQASGDPQNASREDQCSLLSKE
ncbi:MAG: HD domain-containing protein [Desulfovibrionaceae bacterium]|nr:HD domain-containing protein [Desulfovibrionaceae bacterium]